MRNTMEGSVNPYQETSIKTTTAALCHRSIEATAEGDSYNQTASKDYHDTARYHCDGVTLMPTFIVPLE